MVTLGLALITNDEAETKTLVERYSPYFDKFFITVADKDKKLYNRLKNLNLDKAELSYFEWVDHFGKARLFNQTQVKTDYWMWVDVDDEIVNPENLRQVVNQMVANEADIMFMNYDYYQNPNGEQQANHWRERIIRTASECKWEEVPCHETVPAKGIADKTELCAVKHHKPLDQMIKSMERNQKMLEKDWKRFKDPRTAYYLGMTYQYHQAFDKAINKFLFLIEHGGWDEQKVISWNYISNCYFFLGKLDEALQATDNAIDLDPSHPDAYWQKVLIYAQKQDYSKAAEWTETAFTKKTNPDTMQLIDPTKYTYRGLFLAAQSNLFLGRPDKALDYFNQAVQIAPHYIQEMNQSSGVDWSKTFIEAYNEHNAVNAVKFLTVYLKDKEGNLKNLFESLPPKMSYDPRLFGERRIALPPKKWKDKSVAYYCGPGFEPWGPDYLKNGLGGSEEAVLYLSRELTKLGWQITVFCQRDKMLKDQGVTYKPWSDFNPQDEFNILIAWRRPEFLQGVMAKKKILDLHDTMPEEALLAVEADQFMVKSDFHRSLYSKIPDNKIRVVSNGIFEGLNYAI